MLVLPCGDVWPCAHVVLVDKSGPPAPLSSLTHVTITDVLQEASESMAVVLVVFIEGLTLLIIIIESVLCDLRLISQLSVDKHESRPPHIVLATRWAVRPLWNDTA